MYFVETGTLVVLKQMDGEEKPQQVEHVAIESMEVSGKFQVNELQPGKYFGELGLVNHAPRQATVVARDDVRVACEYFLIKQIVPHSPLHYTSREGKQNKNIFILKMKNTVFSSLYSKNLNFIFKIFFKSWMLSLSKDSWVPAWES